VVLHRRFTDPEQLWVSDITYVKTIEGYCYLSLITDAYSRKIVGHCLYPNLASEGWSEALEISLNGRLYPDRALIHHSDRGVQYCSHAYVNKLLLNNVSISMTQSGSPYENALAERMNGIIKSEFWPHSSLNYLTPETVHTMSGPMPRKPRDSTTA